MYQLCSLRWTERTYSDTAIMIEDWKDTVCVCILLTLYYSNVQIKIIDDHCMQLALLVPATFVFLYWLCPIMDV